VTVEYDTAPEWIDELVFTYYALFQGFDEEADRDVMRLCKGKVTCVNIPRGRSHRGAMWLHPHTVERYGELRYLAVVIEQDGKVVGSISEPESETPWWERFQPIGGVFYNRYQLPVSDDDDFPAVKAGDA
jgi:hypothetical protein